MLALPSAASVLSDASMMAESATSEPSTSHGFAAVSSTEPSSANSSSPTSKNYVMSQDMNGSHLISYDLMSHTKTNDALDALAALATSRATLAEDTATITPHQTSSDEESTNNNAMPPPPPREALPTTQAYTAQDESRLLRELPALPSSRTTGRLRSASNPEGMEKWDSYSRRNDRQHFFLPSSILEEELASTRKVLGESGAGGSLSSTVSGFQFTNYSYYDQGKVQEFTMLTPDKGEVVSYSATATTAGMTSRTKRQIKQPMRFEDAQVLGTAKNDTTNNVSDKLLLPGSAKRGSRKKTKSPELSGNNNCSPEEEVDESNLEPEELLRRARSRLLEDLSEENADGEKGVLTLPHSLHKYKEVYNKHGRIGIYTPSERAAIITKFNAKRARRVWNKKIRYNCRKNLADRRMRIKGRFVKRSVETMEASPENNESTEKMHDSKDTDTTSTAKQNGTPPTSGSPLPPVDENKAHDEEMPDVEDEEADFSPTDDMPYRRTRRYTIT